VILIDLSAILLEFLVFFQSNITMKVGVANLICLILGLLSPVIVQAEDRFERMPIQYSQSKPNNVVSLLQAKLVTDEVEWVRERYTGYLRPLLKALGVGVESQTLVFTKTSLQGRLISPSRPRALYFNDNVYVGYVPGSHLLEVSVADPSMGAVFFTFDQNVRRLKRNVADCMSCHGSSRTDYKPGHLLRSVYPAEDGHPILRAGGHLTNHESPYEKRWGGWYVSGRHGIMRHMGNALAKIDDDDTIDLNRNSEANTVDLGNYFNTTRYLSSHSDIVAMLVQDHQVHMHNLLAAANYETRYALYDQQIIDNALDSNSSRLRQSTRRRIASAGEKFLRYMLFAEEVPLPDEVRGTTTFSKTFSARGPNDREGRSLYQLDLKTRLLKYPCSYLIYSEAFDQLPVQMKEYLYRRLWEILSGQDQSDEYARLKPSMNRTILEILIQTKDDLPDYWKLDG
jgi:hypothetical protein